ncbi:MAG: rRNA pseudouridine synthase [Clostridiales bacterium]|nr:rRNA pseudouridine synthase [Clostridiales bacterium]
MSKLLRLDKYLSSQGFGSRTQAQQLIKKGHVRVDDQLVLLPATKVDPQKQTVQVDGKEILFSFHHHLMFYKPSGYITAVKDPRHPTVAQLLPKEYLKKGCMPVGRLDKDTTGLLLFTTDGALAHGLLAPKQQIKKAYEVIVEGILSPQDIEAFAKGICLKDFTTLPAVLEILSVKQNSSHAIVTLFEGKYHQVKRMFLAIGKPVLSLHRQGFASLLLDSSLSPGSFRPLSDKEVDCLYQDLKKGDEPLV